MNQIDFDAYAEDYEAQLNRGLSISGEDRVFFAKGRIEWLAKCLARLRFVPTRVLDFGCGTGFATPFFLELLRANSVLGVDLSAKSLDVARRTYASLPVEYIPISEYKPDGTIDLAFCNGVFHHIQPNERLQVAQYVANCLRPGGLFVLWENNPWNPGTRYIMSRVPFDRDAVMLSARTARALVGTAGFRVVRTDYCFVFPKFLSTLRKYEKYMARLPIGAQYQVLCQKSMDEFEAQSHQ
jgi:SAM-dependent methyltransferase